MRRFHATIVACLVLALVAAPAEAGRRHRRNACSDTARALRSACDHDVRDDRSTATAVCLNATDDDEREECIDEARDAYQESRELCRDQYEARRDFCKALDEDRYDPEVDPADYEEDFASPSNPNPHYPIAVGNAWEYAGGDETIRVEVRDETKLIEGVTCVVVNDVVEEGGEVIEDTDDWIALRLDGGVDYFGEVAKNFESFEGDDPGAPELVDIDGSFKAGRDGAKKGTLFPASPAVDDVYREEWALGDAEDGARILAVDYGFGGDRELDEHVPAALANHLCSNDCVVTENFTPLEPEALERKYYAPGIGLFLEVDPESGDTVELVGCNVDPRCGTLP
jgi:hypothetical protein